MYHNLHYVKLLANNLKTINGKSADDNPHIKRDNNTEEQTKFKISTEEQSIKETAKANGTYMKAPNGKPTKLSERRWLQVRTKAFKKWFGDWEKAARIEKLRKSEPIEITGKEVTPSDDLKEYKKNALEYGKSLRGEYTNKDTKEVIGLGKNGVKEVLQHDYKNIEQLQSVAAIPQIIENGIYIDTSPNEDFEKNPDVKEYQYYVCGLKIGEIDYTVRSAIAVDSQGNRYYDHKLTQIEKGTLLDVMVGITNPVSQKENFLSDIKDKRLLSLLQTNVSKVVDENGEPMSEAVDEFDERIKYKQVIDEKSGVLTNDDKMTRRDKFNRLIIDSFAPVEKLKNIIKKLGGHIGVYSDPVGQAYLMLSKAKSNYDYFNLNHFAPMLRVFTEVQSLFRNIGLSKNDKKQSYKDVLNLLYAMHAIERNKVICSNEVLKKVYESINNVYFGQKISKELRALISSYVSMQYDNALNNTNNQLSIGQLSTISDDQMKIFAYVRDNVIGNSIAEIFASKQGNNRSGMTDIKANEIIGHYYTANTKVKVDELWEKLRACTNYNLELQERYGLISAEQRVDMQNMYKHYIPLRGWEEREEIDYSDFTPESKLNSKYSGNFRAMGRTSMADDFLAYISQMVLSSAIVHE